MKTFFLVGLFALSSASAQTGAQVFSFSTPSLTLLLQWAESNGQLTGAAQVVSVSPTKQTLGLEVTNASLNGTKSGASYAFVLSKALTGIGVNSLVGTVSGDTLNIQIPSTTGGFTSLLLKRTTLDTFSADVAALKKAASNAQNEMTKADRLTNSQDAVTAAIRVLDADTTPFSESISNLGQRMRELPSVLLALQTRSADLKRKASGQQCEAFRDALERDVLAREGIDETMSRFSDEIEANTQVSEEVESWIARYGQAIEQFRPVSPSGASELEKSAAPLLTQEKRLLKTNNLAQAKKVQADALALIDRLTTENDALTCE